jgi:hypothetical protein
MSPDEQRRIPRPCGRVVAFVLLGLVVQGVPWLRLWGPGAWESRSPVCSPL